LKKMNKCALLLLALLLTLTQLFMVHAQSDIDHDGISDVKEVELAQLYAPCLQFKAGERFFPVDIDYHITNSVLKFRSGEEVSVVDPSPTVATLSTYTEEYYFLDNKLGGMVEIAEDYSQKRSSLGYTVYAHVTRDANYIVIQYWFFYAYNDATLNQHEGDWEMIEVLLDNSENPVSAVYSQHMRGQRSSWVDVDKTDGTHPIVYVAKGSHANYFRPYQGSLGLENDEVGADGLYLTSSAFHLIILGEHGSGNHPPSQDWLDFGGRWGDWAKLADAAVGFAGPHGPGHGENRDKWCNPVLWGQSLQSVDTVWFGMSWLAVNFLYIYLGIAAVLGLWKVWKIVKLKRMKRLRLLTILRRKAALGILLGLVSVFLTIAGMLLPWYTLKANIQTTALSTSGEVDLLLIDGLRGVQANFLVKEGLSTLFNLRIPLGILVLVSVIFGILDIIGVEKAKSLGNKYIRSGIIFLVLIGILVIVIFQLTSVLPNLASSVGIPLPQEAIEIARSVAQQPLQGERSFSLGEYGWVYLAWGLELGTYMFIAAAIVKLIGGIILRKTVESTPST